MHVIKADCVYLILLTLSYRNYIGLYYITHTRSAWTPPKAGKELYKTLCQLLSNVLRKMPKYGQTLSKQDEGAKWLTIHKNLWTNRAQYMCSTSIVYTNELGKRKAAVVSLHPMKRPRSTSLASLPQETTKNIEVYKINGRPKRKG